MPFDPSQTNANLALSVNNTQVSSTSPVNPNNSWNSRSDSSHQSGKFYWENVITSVNIGGNNIGAFSISSVDWTTDTTLGLDTNSLACFTTSTTAVFINNASVGTFDPMTSGDTLSIAIDIKAKLLWGRINAGNWNSNAANDPATGVGGIDISTLAAGRLYTGVGIGTNSDVITMKFGASAFSHSVPSGYSAWDSELEWANVFPDPVIKRTLYVAHTQAFAIDAKWVFGGAAPITDLRKYWYQPLSEPVRIRQALPAPEHHFFSIDYKWINPVLDLRDYWYQPLSEPRIPPDRRNILPTPEHHFFSVDYKWIAPPGDLSRFYWYQPLSEPRTPPDRRNNLIAAEQQFFSIDYKWVAPPGNLSNFYWYQPLSEPRTPPDRRNVLPIPEQQFFSVDYKWSNPVTDLRTWGPPPLTEPVRFRAFPTPEQHFFSIDYKWITPTGDLQNYWYEPLTEPVRLKPGLPAPEQHFFSIDFKWIAPPGDLSAFYWYRPLEEPVRYRPLPMPTAEQQYFTIDYKWLNPTTDLRNYWYAPLTEPVRLKPGLPTPEQLAFTIDFQWVAPSGDLGKYYWYRPLEDPVRYRTFPAPYHQDFIMDAKWLFTGVIINDLRNFWFVSLNEPVRLKPGLPTSEQLSFATDWKWITPTLALQNYWYQPLGEPVRFRVFPTTENQDFTVDYKWTNPVTDLRTWPAPPLSEPTRYRPLPFLSPYQQPFTTDTNTPLFFPNWYEPLNEPLRLKPGLPAPEQQYFSIDYKWANPVTDLSLWEAPPLTEPVRLKIGLATQHQIAFTMDWQWVAPIQVNVSYSLSAIELFDILAAKYAASDLIIGANVTITEIGNKPTANVAMTEIVKDLL